MEFCTRLESDMKVEESEHMEEDESVVEKDSSFCLHESRDEMDETEDTAEIWQSKSGILWSLSHADTVRYIPTGVVPGSTSASSATISGLTTS